MNNSHQCTLVDDPNLDNVSVSSSRFTSLSSFVVSKKIVSKNVCQMCAAAFFLIT